MAEVAQIYEIVNDSAKQAYGTSPVNVINTSTLVALGNFVLKSDTNVDLFVNALTDRIGKTIFSTREYFPEDDSVVKKPFDFGIILQKIYVDLPDAEKNNAWEIGKQDYKPTYAPVIKPSVKQKLFNNLTTFEIDVTIPDDILKTAFTSPTGMAQLISAVFVAIDNRIKIAIESCSDLVRASFIARKIQGKKPCGAINLLDAYNSLTNESLTVDACMRDLNFLKYATMQINLWAKRMRRISTLFNEEGYKRHTPKDLLVVTLLDEFASASSTYLQADTYHKELVSLPMYNTVPYWQGSGESFDFSDTSKINVQLDAETIVEQSGVIGVLYDWEALGVTIDNRRTDTERNSKDEYTNYYNKVNRGYFNDMSENAIVFYVAEV